MFTIHYEDGHSEVFTNLKEAAIKKGYDYNSLCAWSRDRNTGYTKYGIVSFSRDTPRVGDLDQEILKRYILKELTPVFKDMVKNEIIKELLNMVSDKKEPSFLESIMSEDEDNSKEDSFVIDGEEIIFP